MQNRAELKAELVLIRDNALSAGNPHKLDYSEKSHLQIVIKTLIYLLDNMDRLRDYGNCYFNDGAGIAPIHLENYMKHGRILRGEECEIAITSSLIKLFISIFNNLRGIDLGEGSEHVKIFCGKLNAYCIDARTREAFEYGLKFAANMPFTDMFNFSIKKLAPVNQGSYCWITAAVLNNIWLKDYTPDKGEHAIAKKPGRIDASAFGLDRPAQPEEKKDDAEAEILDEDGQPIYGLINQYLRATSCYTPNNDFLVAYKSVKPEMRETYFKIILSQREFVKKNIFVLKPLPADKQGKPAAVRYNAMRLSVQIDYDEFILEQYLTLIAMTNKGDIPKTVLKNFISTTSPIVLLKIWKKPEFAAIIRNNENKECAAILVEAFLLGMETDKKYLKEFFETPLTTGETIIHFVTQSNSADLVGKAIQTAIAGNIDIWQPNSEGDSPIVYAVKHELWEAVTPLILNNPEEEKAEDPEQEATKKMEYGKALLCTTAHAQWNISIQLINAGAQANIFNPGDSSSALHLVTLGNNPDMIDLLLSKGADINQAKPTVSKAPTALVTAASSRDVTVDTMIHILFSPGLDINRHNQGVQALAGAAMQDNTEKMIHLLTTGVNVDATLTSLKGDAPQNATNILNLFLFIKRLLANQLQDKLDTRFLANIEKRTLTEIFSLALSTGQYPHLQINKARHILNRAYNHAHANDDDNNPLSFNEREYETTTAVLNNLLTVAHNSSNDNQRYEWQGQIRNGGYEQLEAAVDAEHDLLKKKELLVKARSEVIFSEHRSQFFLFRFGRTGAQIKIDDKLKVIDDAIKAAARPG
ncbi:MAG: hypothetical protein P4M14_12345 [Gammaproteobacteria bacterium]|nr:hypothetical protein [Gammaproteobacteria bacterium]